MNRLIIIGNGFDLAHGTKTSYYDFISSYLKDACEIASKKHKFSDSIITVDRNFNAPLKDLNNYNSLEQLLSICGSSSKSDFNRIFISEIFGDNDYDSYPKCFTLKFHNKFVETLFNKCKTLRWVDIENEFYEELKEILSSDNNKDKRLSALNTTMQDLINALENYMFSLPMPKPISAYVDLFKEEIHRLDNSACPIDKDASPSTSYILNFNYTKTIEQYMGALHYELNYIHGKAFEKNNPIIFGFGDEIDKDYKKIEEEKTKGFFNFIKSFWYFKTSNFHKLIRFLNSDIYQVYIIGHSCGLSDRTMLNMIFENENCKSLKIFYHGNHDHNNYIELTQEISRHFSNKGIMRTKIVSESQSFSMPQFGD